MNVQNPSSARLMRSHFPDGSSVIDTLARVSNGDDAQKLLTTPPLGAAGTIVQLPTFVHIDFNGSPSPNRVLYPETGSVLFVADGEHAHITYEIPNSALPSVAGSIDLTPHSTGGHTVTGSIPDARTGTRPPVTTEVLTGTAQRGQLRHIVDDGNEARFAFAASLQAYTEQAVEAAARSVYSEIVNITPDDIDTINTPAVSTADQETIVTELLYGGEGKQDSVILRMIDRAACTPWAVGMHVSRRMAQGIWGAAETQIRRAINDPHVGRIVRALAREHGIDDPDELLDVFRKRYPTKRMGADRIRRSLEVRDLFTSPEAISAIRSGVLVRPDDRTVLHPRRPKTRAVLTQTPLPLWDEDRAVAAA